MTNLSPQTVDNHRDNPHASHQTPMNTRVSGSVDDSRAMWIFLVVVAFFMGLLTSPLVLLFLEPLI